MRIIALSLLAAFATACTDTTTPDPLLNDAEITSDIAASAGDAVGVTLDGLIGNQLSGTLPFVGSADSPISHDVNFQRTRTCLDAAGNVVANCSPIASVRKIITELAVSGSRSGTRTRDDGVTVSWSGAVHRTLDDTLSRNFNTAQPPAEVSRAHTAIGTVNDTTTFSDGAVTRVAAESALDSVRAVTWNLPRASNPWPTSGSIVRRVSADVAVTRSGETRSRKMNARIQVTFPADAQGNVPLQINDKTCTLNLVTRRVTGCN
jgi:hypothetical protein